jgi:hypothetical protein
MCEEKEDRRERDGQTAVGDAREARNNSQSAATVACVTRSLANGHLFTAVNRALLQMPHTRGSTTVTVLQCSIIHTRELIVRYVTTCACWQTKERNVVAND